MGQKTAHDVEPGKKKLDLSAAQVAGSSLATVAAALLASQMGVYGTILGAGVVSVVATAGGPVIQHFFRRTGDQLRETARPRARRVPVVVREETPEGTVLLRTVPSAGDPAGAPDEEFGSATVHGTRVRGWKRTAVASGAAFALAIGGLGTYEAVAGTSVSSDGRTLLTGGAGTARDHKPDPPAGEPGGTSREDEDGKTPGPGGSPRPSGSTDGDGGRSPGTDPGTTPSGSPSPPATPSTPQTSPTPSGPPASTQPGRSATPSAPAAPPSGDGGSGAGGRSATP
ncbi:hypothetical protein [Streptomyces subrutilus]|nr:hypothetical protein [Streptomyces subrutilus]WSJ32484.1 hypothetical protein OG479_26155 [Streptomyces subrutilus]GGZ60355.1 hypothetical protein GCM10010371_19740 [Streptomyces subrutilus]